MADTCAWTAPLKDDAYLRKKFIALFDNHDVTGNGTFNSADIREMERRIVSIAKMDEKAATLFTENSKKYYDELVLHGEAECDREKFVESLLKMRREDPTAMMGWVRTISDLLYDAVDFNRDGTVDMQEYIAIFRVQWFDDEWLAQEIFHMIDENKDQVLSKDEMANFFLDMMMNQQPDPALDVYFTYRNMLSERDERWIGPVEDDTYLRKKYYSLFDAYDVTGDGKFDRDDIEIMQGRMKAIREFTEEQWQEYVGASNDYFETFVLGGETSVDREKFVEGLLHMRQKNPKGMLTWVKTVTNMTYDTIDFNHDGELDLGEYKGLFRVQWFDDEWLAEEIFKLIDVNGDHIISRDEFEHFFLDLMMHEQTDEALDVYFTYRQILIERDARWIEPVQDEQYLRKKYKSLFDSHDVTGDGLFDQDDITLMQERMQDDAKLNDAQMARYVEMSNKYYQQFLLGGRKTVNQQEFVDGLIFMRRRNPRSMMEWIREITDVLYTAIDFNRDGSIELSEYKALFTIQFIDDPWLAEEIFKLIDVNHDGVVSNDEFEYFFLDLMMHQEADPTMDVYFTYKNLLDELAQKWRGPVTNEAYLRRKYHALFAAHDVNKDGVFDDKDVEMVKEGIAKMEKLSEESRQRYATGASRFFTSMYRTLSGGHAPLDAKRFEDACVMLRRHNPRVMEEYVKNMADVLYSSIDFNRDGDVDVEEYVTVFRTFFIDSDSLARQVFSLVDVNGDGIISVGEFEHQMLMIYMNDEPIAAIDDYLRSVAPDADLKQVIDGVGKM